MLPLLPILTVVYEVPKNVNGNPIANPEITWSSSVTPDGVPTLIGLYGIEKTKYEFGLPDDTTPLVALALNTEELGAAPGLQITGLEFVRLMTGNGLITAAAGIRSEPRHPVAGLR
jgi:hypothetical protein